MKKWLVAAIIILLLAGCASEPSPWLCYGGDGSRSLSSSERGPKRPRLLWVAEMEGENPGGPVVDKSGQVYVPHSGGSVTSVQPQGRVQWTFESWVSGSETTPPQLLLLPRDKILLLTLGAQEQTFELSSSGETVVGPTWFPWPAATGPAVTEKGYTLACHQYVTNVGTVGLLVYGLVKGGEVLWSQDFSNGSMSYYASIPVLLENGRGYVFVETDGDKNFLLALGSAGEILWQVEFLQGETRGVGRAIAASQDGTIYLGTPRIEDVWRIHSPGWLYAVDASGQLLWRVEAGQKVEQILVAPDFVVANILRTKLLALNSQGEELWQYKLTGWESNAVMDSRGTVYMAGINEGTVWLRAVDSQGREVWEFDTEHRAESVSYAALVQGTIFLATETGKLLAISD